MNRQLVALAMAVGSAALVNAQSATTAEDPARDRVSHRAPAIEQLQMSLGPTLTADFPGGTLAEYIDAIKHAAGADAPTVMIRGDATTLLVGPVELRQIAMFSALQLLEGYHPVAENPRAFRVETANVGTTWGGEPAYLVNIADGRGSGPVSRDFRILPVREITEALPGDPPEIVLPAETVLTAIETVIGITDADGGDTEIRFHPESGLLMLAGPTKSLDAAEEVLARIAGDVELRRERARELQRAQGLTNPDALERELADARAEAEMAVARVNLAEQRLAATHEELEQQRVLADAGTIPATQFREMQLHVLDQETQFREQQIKLERTMQRVEHVQTQLERSKQIVTGGGPSDALDALRAENAMLRERLAAVEARVFELNNQLKGRDERGR